MLTLTLTDNIDWLRIRIDRPAGNNSVDVIIARERPAPAPCVHRSQNVPRTYTRPVSAGKTSTSGIQASTWMLNVKSKFGWRRKPEHSGPDGYRSRGGIRIVVDQSYHSGIGDRRV